jgi:hypothetical protein
MTWRARWRVWKRTHGIKHAIAAFGWVLIIVSPAVGILPGPGGTIVFAAGLALVLQTSLWAKRLYVRSKRRWPKAGSWLDWGLRRKSAARRNERKKLALATASD